jgi:hypothetical protein
VNPITATKNSICANNTDTIQLSCTPLGGIWSLSNNNVRIESSSTATANPVIIIATLAAGKTYITYTAGIGRCKSTSTFLLKLTPTAPPPTLNIGFEK